MISKSKVFLLLVFLMTVSCSAQEKPQAKTEQAPATKLEAISLTKGDILVKDFYKLGKIGGRFGEKLDVNAVVIYQPGQEATRTKGLRIESQGTNEYDNDIAFLDLEEIASLSKAISFMIDLAGKYEYVSKDYTEVEFATKGYFRVGFYQEGFKQAAYISSGYVSPTRVFLSAVSDLATLKTKVDQGLALLQEK